MSIGEPSVGFYCSSFHEIMPARKAFASDREAPPPVRGKALKQAVNECSSSQALSLP
jgi:hypothetical protein